MWCVIKFFNFRLYLTPERIRYTVEPQLSELSLDRANYNQGNKLSGQPCFRISMGQLRKTVLSMTPQAMYNQFKRPSVGSVREPLVSAEPYIKLVL